MHDGALDANEPPNLPLQPTPFVEHLLPHEVLHIEWTDDDLLRGPSDIAEDEARHITHATQALVLQPRFGNDAGHRNAGLEHRHSRGPSLRLANRELSSLNHLHGGVSAVFMLAAVALVALFTLKVVLHRRRRFQQYQSID
ncbi:hypothetical protein SPRG_21458 [Saprolegnia parasitica CBS 223.65]|uniref:Uncharacterized protein n=1 Tax=Saprolegnia parasitica (strain CBS 223.65) TaxID=695850 RepID=A0A067BNA1_SAPPC|nr:hypothetical protein SPRG_21458 [Saprolegnia parasitica CBS 223.65]KDO19693.1 hypothetical protein SPRG_21458 [Saprolegnia parasitica CBS 223.65]|eukprot:XP_012209619.1 hypothetical protein SPRG_21458 [Saprolegnia parasitica CBS 223.65]